MPSVIENLSDITQEELDALLGGTPRAVTLPSPDGTGGGTYVETLDGWMQVPYGVDPANFAAMSPSERLTAQLQADARETRDTNRGAILTGLGDVLSGQEAADDSAGDREAALRDWFYDQSVSARDQDLASYGELAGGARGANQMDMNTLSAMTALYGDSTSRDNQAVSRLASSAAGAGQRDLDSLAGFNAAAADATGGEQRALTDLRDAYGAYDTVDPGVWGDDLTSQAGSTQADQRAIDAQMAALAEMYARGGTGLTAVERAQMERARRTEERDRRSAMQAHLNDLGARGMRGSGAEIGAMLGAQSQTSENRMLQDMMALASAQERSDRNLANAADLAGGIRSQSFGEGMQTGESTDAMATYNRNNSTAYNQWLSDFQQAQEQQQLENQQRLYGETTGAVGRTYDRSGDQFDAGQDTTAALYGREGDVYDASRTATDASYERGADVASQAYGVSDAGYDRIADTAEFGANLTDQNYTRAGDQVDLGQAQIDNDYNRERDRQGVVTDYTGLFTNQGTTDSNAVRQATETELGRREARRAEDMLDDDEGLLGLGIGPL